MKIAFVPFFRLTMDQGVPNFQRFTCYDTESSELPDKVEGAVRIVFLSDTHNLHERLLLPQGDVLLHAGDFTNKGTMEEIQAFADWIAKLPFQEKIVIPGNHEILLDTQAYNLIASHWHTSLQCPNEALALLESVCTVVVHSFFTITIDEASIQLFGSSYQPRQPKSRPQMAFGRTRGKALKELWTTSLGTVKKGSIDIVITHSPPHGIMDVGIGNKSAGDEELLKAIKKCKPSLHLFGHIHQGRGIQKLNAATTCINGSSKEGNSKVDEEITVRKPFVIDFFPSQ